ncbi:hypothetical protein DI43_02015 [Geobacillus sp. CAMR12739]|nr:hypothetical protein DI43_02015 [Geobacillus sp. CAMR12739]
MVINEFVQSFEIHEDELKTRLKFEKTEITMIQQTDIPAMSQMRKSKRNDHKQRRERDDV